MRDEYESVGDLTCYLDDQAQTGKGFARCTIRRDELQAVTIENPRATVDRLADVYGAMFLDLKEDQRLLPQLYQHFKSNKYIQLEGGFKNRRTNELTSPRLVVHLSRIDMSRPETIVCEFDSAYVSRVRVG